MTLLSLQDFLLPIPPWEDRQLLSVCLTAAPQDVRSSGWVVVNGDQRPSAWIAAVALAGLFANTEPSDILGLSVRELPPPTLQWLPMLAIDLSLGQARQQILNGQGRNELLGQTPPTHLTRALTWALVDTQGRYLGILDTPALLGYLAQSAPSQPQASPAVTAQKFILQDFNTSGALPLAPPPLAVEYRLGYQLMSYEAAAATHLGKTAGQGGSQSTIQSTMLAQLLLLQTQVTELLQQQQQHHEFLASLSHELKTPLTAILGLTTVLGHPGLGDLNQRQNQYVDVLRQTGQNMMALVQDLLDLSQLEMGQLLLHLQAIDLEPLCRKVITQTQTQVAQLSRLATDKHPIRLHLDPGLSTVVADGLRFRQILGNILSHALHSSSLVLAPADSIEDPAEEPTEAPNPTPGVNPEVDLKIWQWPGWICWQIRDRGCGIPVEQQALIFEQFLRLNYPHSQRTHISSLGLLLARRLAQLQGGELSFWSFPQRDCEGIGCEVFGSEFTLLLPQPLTAAVTDDISIAAASPSPRTVLVATSGLELQQDLLRYLQPPQTLLLVARSLTELLVKAQHLQPTVILLDPEFATVSTLNQLHSQSATQAIPIGCLGTTVMETPNAVFHLTVPIQPVQLEQMWQDLADAPSPQPLPKPSWQQNPVGGSPPRPLASKPGSKVNLTVLRLGNHTRLYLQQCRVLEADDLEQAELLSRIWQPDVLLWDWNYPDPLAALLELSRHSRLAGLPLVILDMATTRAAAQLPQLHIFPCLIAETLAAASLEQASQTLFQVLQVAASHTKPVN